MMVGSAAPVRAGVVESAIWFGIRLIRRVDAKMVLPADDGGKRSA